MPFSLLLISLLDTLAFHYARFRHISRRHYRHFHHIRQPADFLSHFASPLPFSYVTLIFSFRYTLHAAAFIFDTPSLLRAFAAAFCCRQAPPAMSSCRCWSCLPPIFCRAARVAVAGAARFCMLLSPFFAITLIIGAISMVYVFRLIIITPTPLVFITDCRHYVPPYCHVCHYDYITPAAITPLELLSLMPFSPLIFAIAY